MPEFVVTIIFTALGIAVTLIFSYIGFKRAEKKDNKEEGESMGVIMSELGYIKSSTDDIKRENRETAARIGGLSERITRCEESCKQAHRRINELRGGE